MPNIFDIMSAHGVDGTDPYGFDRFLLQILPKLPLAERMRYAKAVWDACIDGEPDDPRYAQLAKAHAAIDYGPLTKKGEPNPMYNAPVDRPKQPT